MRVAAAITCMLFLVIAPATCYDVLFNLRQEHYAPFVQRVRDQVQDPVLQFHGIPMINSPANIRHTYLYVGLNAHLANNQAFTIGLQFRRSDLYLLAYHDQVDGKARAFYFRGEIPEADVFPNVANVKREQMRVQFDYISLEAAAGQEINELQLGVESLESVMRNIYGRKDVSSRNPFKRDQARFLLIAIQMVAEAARFKNIEKKADFSLSSDYQVKSLVNKWGALSEQIAASGTTGTFRHPVILEVALNRFWTITNVNQIKPDMALLKYVRVRATFRTSDDDDDKLPRSSLEDSQNGRAVAY